MKHDNTPKAVYNIVESGEGKSRWVLVGSAFVNRDGSMNVILDTYPTEGKLQIRNRIPAKEGA